jgi:hypothetical protein
MALCALREDEFADRRLEEVFGVTKTELHKIVFAAFAGRSDATPHHPTNAGGLYAYLHGTAALRDVFCAKEGWELNRTGNVESVYHRGRNIKIVFQNSDSAADPANEPRAISDKGPAARQAVAAGQMWLLPELAPPQPAEDKAAVWFFCVHIDGEEATAELAWPAAVEDKQFQGFNDRIAIVKPGEWSGLDLSDDDDAQDDIDVPVTRKK